MQKVSNFARNKTGTIIQCSEECFDRLLNESINLVITIVSAES